MTMTLHDEKRRSLMSRLSRGLGYTAPALVLAASGAAFQAVASESPAEPIYTSGQEAPLMLAEAHEEEEMMEGEAEGEAEGHEKEGEAEGEAEGHEDKMEGEGEGEAEGEAEG